MSDCTVRGHSQCSPCLSQQAELQAASLARLRVSSEVQTKASLTVRTSEGDTVTLSTGRGVRADLASIAYDRTGRATVPDLSAQVASAELSTIKAVEAVVDGELSEQEREDLNALLTSIDEVAAAFFNGRSDQAVEHAFEIRDLGSLQSYRFEASYSSSTYIEQAVLSEGTEGVEADRAIAESGALAEAIENFLSSFLRQREDYWAPLSLKALLPSPSDREKASPESMEIDALEKAAPVSDGDGQAQAEPSSASVEHSGAGLDAQTAEPEASVLSEPTAPEVEEAPTHVELEAGPADAATEPQRQSDQVVPDPLGTFAQQIRERVEAAGLNDTRLSRYVPSLIQRLVDYRILVLVSSLRS